VFSWLENHYQSPFFLFINYYDPHHPYLPPDKDFLLFKEDEVPEIDEFEKRKRDKLARYDGEIAFVDYHMGKLFEKLRELNIYDPTMIIITSDHGEFFGEHDCWTHFYELYQEVITIPLIIKYPSSYSKKGVYINRVSLLDIMPTILNFLKIPLPENLQGVNLFEGRSRVMAEIYRHKYIWPQRREGFARELKALFLNNYKYIKEYQKESKGKKELYDIDNDPRELYNLIDAMPDKAKEMEMKLTEWVSYDETRIPLDEPVKLDKKTEENLRVLGYIQ
jgi:arylsulfatase A-like enzyme